MNKSGIFSEENVRLLLIIVLALVLGPLLIEGFAILDQNRFNSNVQSQQDVRGVGPVNMSPHPKLV